MFEILNRHRAEEIEALDGIAARLLEIRQLLLCFNPLGNRLVSEHCSQIRDRIDDDPGLVAVMIDKERSGMNSPGETIPTPGRFQRIRASAPMIFCVFRETLG